MWPETHRYPILKLVTIGKKMTTYIKLNKANWDERAALHAASKEYALDRFFD